jgi:NADPH:quinone reductase-like Zn-dependent oxidoreductase
VITTASARNFDFLSQLGANEMIDYRTERFEDSARDVDVVFDTVGGETL